MCTVTLVRAPGSRIRLITNRDEQRTRPPADPPRIVNGGPGDVALLMPVDPASGGTWVAGNEAGVIATLLNFNPTPPFAGRPAQSRGTLIPEALAAGGFEAALDVLESVHVPLYAPFRLVLSDGASLALVRGDGSTLDVECERWDGRPRMWTSSGLGDDLVETPRRDLFDATLAASPSLEAQESFHRHGWPDRGELSVFMARPDARTVSITTVDLGVEAVEMTYAPVTHDATTDPATRARLARVATSGRE